MPIETFDLNLECNESVNLKFVRYISKLLDTNLI